MQSISAFLSPLISRSASPSDVIISFVIRRTLFASLSFMRSGSSFSVPGPSISSGLRHCRVYEVHFEAS